MGKNLFFWFVTSQSNQTEPLYLHPRFKVRTFVSQSRRLNYLPQPATLRRNATRPRYRYQSRSFYRYLSRSPTHSMVIEGPTPALDERRSRSFVVAWLLRGAWTFPSQRRRQDAREAASNRREAEASVDRTLVRCCDVVNRQIYLEAPVGVGFSCARVARCA